MGRPETNILKHVRAIRRELEDVITPRRTYAALQRRVLARLDRIEALLRNLDDPPANA